MRSIALVATLVCLPAAPALGSDAPFHEPNAVILNITQDDLNRVVRDLFHANGASTLEGTRDRPSRGIYDFRYRVGLSEPVLLLEQDRNQCNYGCCLKTNNPPNTRNRALTQKDKRSRLYPTL